MASSRQLSPPTPTPVARGQHTVPEGIAVLEFLDGDQDKIANPPSDVTELLELHQLSYVYEYFVSKFCRKGKTYLTSKGQTCWFESRLVAVVQEFHKDFHKKKVRLALCIFNSECGNYRWFWLEFIDTTVVADSYKSEYDVSDSRLVLHKDHMVPPVGVEVHQMEDLAIHKFKSKIPPEIKALLEAKGQQLWKDYEELVQIISDCKTTRTWADSWKTTEVLAIVKEHENRFHDQDIELIVCKRPIGGGEFLKWIEVWDTNLAPHYVAVHSVDTEKRKECSERYHTMRSRSHGQSVRNGNANSVAVQDLVADGVPKGLDDKCPSEVIELLERRGLTTTDDYNLLFQAIEASKSMRNFCDLWRLTQEGLVSFAALDTYRATFLEKGIRLVLCESVGKAGRNYWLEYVDVKANPDYSSPYDVHFATQREQELMEKGGKKYKQVIGGRHRIPVQGVAVEELTDAKTLKEPCPPDVQALLEPKGLVALYDKMIKGVASSGECKSWTNNWHSEGIATFLKDFQNEFQERGVKVVVCKLKPETGESFRWFEFIDTDLAADYVPQYDVCNLDEELETAWGYKVQFPKGVVVEKMMDRKTLVELMPPSVQALMEKKDCMDLYDALVDVLCQSVLGDNDQLSETNMKELSLTLGPKFEAKGVKVFLSQRPEPAGGNPLLWIEFVDRELQPNYVAQHGIEMERLPAKGMSKEEMMVASSNIATAVFEEVFEMALMGGMSTAAI